MKKTNGKRFLALVMTFVFVCLTICYTALPISAVSNGDFYTSDDINSILSGNYNFSELTTGEEEIPFSFDNFPMKTRYTLDNGIYYMFFKSDATMFGYGNNGFNSINYEESYSGSTHLWILESVDSESFYLKWAQDTNLCLKVNPSTNTVYLDMYVEGDSNQNWTLYLTSNGIRLASKSTNANANNKSFYYNNGNCSVSSTNISYVGFFDLYWWKPCASISMPNFSMVVGENRVIYPDCRDSYGNASTDAASGPWFEHTTVSGGNKASVSSNATVTAHFPGIERLRITNRITGATTTYDVTVNMASALAVTPVVQAQPNWCWAACAEMVGKYYSPNSTVTQYLLANRFVGGENVAVSNPLTIEYAIEDACNIYGNTGTEYYFSRVTSVSKTSWCDEIVNNGPIFVTLHDAYGNGHAIVMIGVTVSGTFENPIYNYTYIDPANGKTYTEEFSGFLQYGVAYPGMKFYYYFYCNYTEAAV